MVDPKDYPVQASSSYLSLVKKWEDGSVDQRMVHVEANYYGRLYRESGSAKYLDLAVSSLLDAAKFSDAYPCRNFWNDWVIKAIGPGQSLGSPLQKPFSGRAAVVYAAQDSREAYAFSVQGKLYPPITYPLDIVVSVFQSDKDSPEWHLVRLCD